MSLKKVIKVIMLTAVIILAVTILVAQYRQLSDLSDKEEIAENLSEKEPLSSLPEPTATPVLYEECFAASSGEEIKLYNSEFEYKESVVRGSPLTCLVNSEETYGEYTYTTVLLSDGTEGFVLAENIVESYEESVLEQILYVRTATNLYESPDSYHLGAFAEKETELQVLGFDSIRDDGTVRMYKVSDGTNEGYIRSWYVTSDREEATGVYSEELQQIHVDHGDEYNGGNAADLDYWPRDKSIEPAGMTMPETVKALYVPGYPSNIDMLDDYIELADSCDINAFVVCLSDGGDVYYPSEIMAEENPESYNNWMNTREEYTEFIQRLKDAGYYVIGRITTFHDDTYAQEHPEQAIANWDGSLRYEAGGYWPSAFSRKVWEYKLSLALEAVEWFGLDEIQFDYVRFPDGTYEDDLSGSIDYRNEYGESKAQAIQRFLMYVTDELHEKGVYVSADVFGETSNYYVSAYGQYWPAISNVVDVISAMPYPDHYSEYDGYYPWEHPYETLASFSSGVCLRQEECPTPAVVRTWIQCYDSIKEPTVYYYSENVGQEIQALYDYGLTGGFIPWNPGGDYYHYAACIEAWNLDPEETIDCEETEMAEEFFYEE